jgi:hypothetical protein
MIVRQRQAAIRREIDRRGIALKAVEQDSGIPYPTLLSYFPGGEREPSVIPMSAVYALADGRALPTDMLSLLLPAGMALVEVPEDLDFDNLADRFTDFLHEKNAAHHPASPAGTDISDCEREKLSSKVVHLPLGRVA